MSRNARSDLIFALLAVLAAGIFLPVRAQASNSSTNDGPPQSAVVYRTTDPLATEAFAVRPARVREMVGRGVKAVTGKTTVQEAWSSLISTQDVVGLKAYSLPGPYSGTRPAVVAAVIEGLLSAGLAPTNIVVWDRNVANLRLAGFFDLKTKYGVRVEGSIQANYDRATFYENPVLGNLVWGDVEFGQTGDVLGRKSYVSNLVSKEITKHINIAPLLNHTAAGVSGILFSLALGSVDNVARFEGQPDRLAVAVPEIYALPALSDRVVLNIMDALICQYEGGERGRLHSSATLNELWFSLDPVALDSLAIQELERQRALVNAPRNPPNRELYKNANLLELGVADPAKVRVEDVH